MGNSEDKRIVKLTPAYDMALAELVRENLKKSALDIPGTVYYDDNLNHLSDYYLSNPQKRYYCIVLDKEDALIGGIGLAECDFFEDCCELQKLYLADNVKGSGFSYYLIAFIEHKAAEMVYMKLYLETHDNLPAAIHVYEKCGYKEIDRPESVVHSGMNRFFVKELV